MKIGVDIIEIDRFENIASDINRLKTLFTEKEIKYFDKYKQKLEHVAGNFAAKEAVVKAFKTGFNAKIVPLDVEVVHDNIFCFLTCVAKPATSNIWLCFFC